ncbi:hypothetical protein Syun_019934 [Stephania yunnanensis]|uniref:Uncharacterized protein n=1 Tax=Stephania yunnanensis TaxID=152371 RepID=A0AAP0NWA7_9MAGN
MHGRVGGFTNTEVGIPCSLSAAPRRCHEMTPISIAASSSSFVQWKCQAQFEGLQVLALFRTNNSP